MGLFNKCLFLLDTSVLIKIVSLNIKHKPATVTMLTLLSAMVVVLSATLVM